MLIATAGHVDHGKTRLVRALTGVNTDRLDEEQRRGLSIELGFAFKTINEKMTLGFIDVPGHHRFMNTMIAGVTGIDLGMIVVAADDGPMPQTFEHLQILRLLGVKNFLAVISKVDLVDTERTQEVAAYIRTLLPGTQVTLVSTRTGAGLKTLSDILFKKAAGFRARKSEGYFRMYVDRAFTKKGAGIVVTGTALSGQINIGDDLILHSGSGERTRKTPVKIRNIHAQGKEAVAGAASQRCAINLTGKISVSDIRRGDILSANPAAMPSRRLDTRIWLADTATRPFKHMGRVKLYIGSRKISARTYLLSGRHDAKGERNEEGQRVQFICDTGVLAFSKDRFLIRDDSEAHILGGGVVIDPAAPKRAKASRERICFLNALEEVNAGSAFAKIIFNHQGIISLKQQKRIWNLTELELERILNTPPFNPDNFVRLPRKSDHLILCSKRWDDFKTHLLHILGQWHLENPDKDTIAKDALFNLSGHQIPPQVFPDILKVSTQEGHITQTENHVRLTTRKPKLTFISERHWERLEKLLQDRLPLRSEIEKELGFSAKQIEALARPNIKNGTLFIIGEKRLALASTLRCLADKISEHSSMQAFSVIEAKSAFGLGRNQTIEILEFFDAIKYTSRNGNTRSVVNVDVIETTLSRE